MYRTLRLWSIGIWAACLCLSAASCRKTPPAGNAGTEAARVRVDTTARIILEVSRCARLYTTEYQIHKIVTHSDNPTLEGNVLGMPVKMNTRIGDRKVAIPINVTLKAYIDFGEFGKNNVHRTDSTLVLTLPDPHIVATATRIDNKGTRQYIDLTRSRYTDAEITDFARQGTDSILSHTARLGIVEQAERSAVTNLMPILQRMGFKEKNITIRFRKDFTDSDLIPLIQKQ